jgi:hypothetical protein
MIMVYEILDMRTASLLATFDAEAEATAIVRDAIRERGEDYWRDLVLIREGSDGSPAAVAAAPGELLERVRAPA